MKPAPLNSTIGWAILLLGLFGALKHLAPLAPWGSQVAFLICMAYQLYIPLWLISREGSSYRAYNLHCFGLFEPEVKTDWSALRQSLVQTLKISAITFVPYIVIHHLSQMAFALHYGFNTEFSLSVPNDMVQIVLTNLLLVALPEEIFYRGFLQTRFLRAWPNQTFFLTLPVGRAIVTTSLIFALGHFVGEYNLSRLLPFFPAFVFSALAYRSGSIMGAVIYHALCNTLSEVLYNSYNWS
jgi:membrane protease YdiL (CAAX protease family)